MDNNKGKMTVSFGIGMFFYGMGCLLIGATVAYFIINKLKKENKNARKN